MLEILFIPIEIIQSVSMEGLSGMCDYHNYKYHKDSILRIFVFLTFVTIVCISKEVRHISMNC